ncbi:MAG: hypothetical protein OXC61_11645, partial [Flavobacteriaceae bacterium]|nr:hypothetical protein [Flavobacteriaceae bacterium]
KRSILGKPLKRDTPYQKQTKRKKFRRRAADWPSQNRTSDAGKRSDGRPIANDQRLFGCDGVAFEEIHGTMSPRCSFLLFQRASCSVQRTSIIKRIEL